MSDLLIGYLLHSTVLLSVVGLLMKVARPRSAVLAERLWKFAAVLPVLTSLAIACWPMSREADIVSAPIETERVESVVAENVIETPTDSEVSSPDLTFAVAPVRRMGTLARPLFVDASPVEPLNEIVSEEATGKSAQPTTEAVAPTVEVAEPIEFTATEPPDRKSVV